MVFLKMIVGYAILWTITIPSMIWELLPSNRPKPLANHWKAMGWLLLVVGYPPAIFIIFLSWPNEWNAFSCIVIPMFLGPIFVYAVFKIKHRLIINNDIPNEEPDDE